MATTTSRIEVDGCVQMGHDAKCADSLSDAKLQGQISWMSKEHQASLSDALTLLRLKLRDHAARVENASDPLPPPEAAAHTTTAHATPMAPATASARTRAGPAGLEELEQKLAAMREAHAKALGAIEAKKGGSSPPGGLAGGGTPQQLPRDARALPAAAAATPTVPAGQAALDAFDAKLQAAIGRASLPPARVPAAPFQPQDAPYRAALDAFDAKMSELRNYDSLAACSSLNSTGSTCSGVALGSSSDRSSSAGSSSGQLRLEQEV